MVLTTPATAPASIDGGTHPTFNFTTWPITLTCGGPSIAHLLWADFKAFLMNSKVESSMAWTGALRKALIPFPRHKPRQPWFDRTSRRLPVMLLDPTPTINLVLKKTQNITRNEMRCEFNSYNCGIHHGQEALPCKHCTSERGIHQYSPFWGVQFLARNWRG